jgi:hypothetical protein
MDGIMNNSLRNKLCCVFCFVWEGVCVVSL